MATQCFVERRFVPSSIKLIGQANEILAGYEGFTLTVRQLYYQFVARDLIPNTVKSYKRMASIINDARLAGLVDWDIIEDRTRNAQLVGGYTNPSQIIGQMQGAYVRNPWDEMNEYVEVWIEKDALIGVVEPTCLRLRVGYYACRGYTSQSEQYRAAQRFQDQMDRGREVTIIYLGDHDPSGLDMTADHIKRMDVFGVPDVNVVRLALNMDQVEHFNPPANPAKQKDARFKKYAKKYGNKSWELDALDPNTIAGLIEQEVRQHLDINVWKSELEIERREKEVLGFVADEWPFVQRALSQRPYVKDALDNYEEYQQAAEFIKAHPEILQRQDEIVRFLQGGSQAYKG